MLRRLSIPSRIIGPLAVIVAVAFAAIAAAAVTVTRDGMVERIDEALRDASDVDDPSTIVGPDLTIIVITAGGSIGDVMASGRTRVPDELPAMGELIAVRPPTGQDHIVEVAAGDGSDRSYRALLHRASNGRTTVFAIPLDDVDEQIGQLQRTLAWVAAAALILLLSLSWALIRSGLRPIEGIVDIASEITAGDYSRRVAYTDHETEVGRLGAAINTMLERIELAFGRERESQDRLRRFVADASHELRTPLTSIQGYAQLYRSGAVDDDETRERAMERIETAGSRMADLVQELLLLTHLDHGIVDHRGEVDLVDVARELIVDRRIVEPDRPLVLSGDDTAFVLGDRRQLLQVVGNLLDNACRHTPPGTLVVVAVGESHGIVELHVTDHGDGLTDADAALIFDRFHRTERSRARRTGGSGLGLAIVKAIVEAHDGSVSVQSAPGDGASFRVRLPAADVPGVVHGAPPTRRVEADSLPES